MKEIFQKIDTLIRWIEDFVCGTALIGIVAIAAANVVGRYIFHTGFLPEREKGHDCFLSLFPVLK